MSRRQPPQEPRGTPRGAGDADDRDDSSRDAGAPWILRGTHSREILARLIDGDPLELEARCEERLREQAVLLPLRRVHLRAVARIAFAAPRYRGEPVLSQFLTERIDASILELVREHREEYRDETKSFDASDAPYKRIAALLGIEPHLAHTACTAFNALAWDERSVCFRVMIEGTSIQSCSAEGHGPPDDIVTKLGEGLRRISRAIGRKIEWPPSGRRGGAKDGS